jgi:hypothetical protein
MSEVHYVLPVRSLFLTVVGKDDIEAERQAREAEWGLRIGVYEVETVTRSGVRMTQVTWEEVG